MWIGREKVGLIAVGRNKCASLWIGTKNGAVKIWEAVSNIWKDKDVWRDKDVW